MSKHWFPPYLLKKIKRYGVRHSELAGILGVEESTISRKLSGGRATTADELRQIVEHLKKRGVKMNDAYLLRASKAND